MNIYEHFDSEIDKIITKIKKDDKINVAGKELTVGLCESPRNPEHGDIATNIAMTLAKPFSMKPRELAEKVKLHLTEIEGVFDVSIDGPGFINLRLEPSMWQQRIKDILEAGNDWGKSTTLRGMKFNVEYVSANPTGPLHAAHARGAVVGDSLAALLEKVGGAVVREYYVNDAGGQVDTLAQSAYLRYREALGENIGEIPAGYYPGEYLIETGKKLVEKYDTKLLEMQESERLETIHDEVIKDMMASIKTDLGRLGVRMDRFSSERELIERGAVEDTIAELEKKGLIYQGVLEKPKSQAAEEWSPREQMLFRSTQFGDDSDRALKKPNGRWTYFASDIAYHRDKLFRSGHLIDIWGADHGGYVKRMTAAVAPFLDDNPARFQIKLCQLVKLLDQGKPVKMSKRAGTFVTLADIIDVVGKDVLRFIMLTRRSDQTLDFDYAKVTEQSRENPVFYVQYASARATSILRQPEARETDVSDANLALLEDRDELALIKLMAGFPRIIESAAATYEPHRIAFYLMDLAAHFHGLWNKGNTDPKMRFITPDAEVTKARLAMVKAVSVVIRSGVAILGVEATEEM